MNILVIGAGYAGTLAALRLAGKTRQRVTLINPADTFVERIRLHQLAAGQAPRRHSLPKLLRGRNIDFVQGRVTAIDPKARTVTLQDSMVLTYNYLVYALGSFVDPDAIPGGREHALTLGGVDATLKLQAKLRENPKARIIICGGGLTGIELSTELAETYPGLSITLLEKDQLGPKLSAKGHEYILDAMKRLNITVHEGVTVERILPDSVMTSDGQRFASDLSIWAGAFGVPSLAREAGIAVNRTGQIIVDPYLRSVSHPEIFAVGDSAATGLRMACATALPIGAHAADNLAASLRGGDSQPFRFAYAARCISLGRHDGLIQWVNADDSPREQVITGRAGAWIKELICRYAYYSLPVERLLPGFYMWLKGKKAQIGEAVLAQ